MTPYRFEKEINYNTLVLWTLLPGSKSQIKNNFFENQRNVLFQYVLYLFYWKININAVTRCKNTLLSRLFSNYCIFSVYYTLLRLKWSKAVFDRDDLRLNQSGYVRWNSAKSNCFKYCCLLIKNEKCSVNVSCVFVNIWQYLRTKIWPRNLINRNFYFQKQI